jgi:hypothetical protein
MCVANVVSVVCCLIVAVVSVDCFYTCRWYGYNIRIFIIMGLFVSILANRKLRESITASRNIQMTQTYSVHPITCHEMCIDKIFWSSSVLKREKLRITIPIHEYSHHLTFWLFIIQTTFQLIHQHIKFTYSSVPKPIN